MNLKQFQDNPFQLRISFHKVIEHLEQVAASNDGLRSEMAASVLKEIEPYPELREGITDTALIEKHATVISHLVADMFPAALTDNEIKAITIPFQDILFNQTRRFQKILDNAGPSFGIMIRDFDDHQFYVFTCCLILDEFYGSHFNFSRPLFYDIPTADGVIKHYRILYNADFIEIIPTADAPVITKEDIDLLRDNFNDLELWKRKFPKNSWIMKGFGLVTLIDATVENAVSSLKGALLGRKYKGNIQASIEEIFRSIYRIPDLKVGFTSYDHDENKFSIALFDQQVRSYLLSAQTEEDCSATLCVESLASLVTEKTYFSVSDVSKFVEQNPESVLAWRFKAQGIQSFILAPVVKHGHLMGVLELVSERPLELNSINANQLELVMPFITDTIDRQYTDLQNNIQAIIQNEYTTIHPSVYWKFKKEAFKFIQYRTLKKDYALREVTFKNVYPLYGQIDIKGSSDTRNLSAQLDLQSQLTALVPLVEHLQAHTGDNSLQQKIEELQAFIVEVYSPLRADTEQHIQTYLDTQIHPLLKQAPYRSAVDKATIDQYFEQADKTGDFHQNRRKYETTVALINEKMALLLDRAQTEAQEVFPHYYERFKTDGVEHNLYIGASIAPAHTFDISYLYNLRLWQLQVLCEMELEHHFLKTTLPYPLDVTSLILAFSLPMSIRFRMDEKRFDVDGTYNARFEIVKKRIDKAFIKGTVERITAIGKITIVYSNHEEELEYKSYIQFLQSKNMLGNDIEMLDVEDLQGISGLKALRVKILYNTSLPLRRFYSYTELVNESKSSVTA
jgi:hypothetical protein